MVPVLTFGASIRILQERSQVCRDIENWYSRLLSLLRFCLYAGNNIESSGLRVSYITRRRSRTRRFYDAVCNVVEEGTG
jgi:hypothetical protein